MKNHRSTFLRIPAFYLLAGILWLGCAFFLTEKILPAGYSPMLFLTGSFLLFVLLSFLILTYFFQNYVSRFSAPSPKKGEEMFLNAGPEKNNQRLIEIIENTSDLVAIATIEGEGVYLNKAGLKMMEADERNEGKVRKFSDAHTPEVQELLRKVAIPHAILHGSWKGETSFISRTGKIIPTSQVVVVHKSDDGKPEFISTISRDISKEKEAEEQLVESLRINRLFNKGISNSPLVMIFWTYKDGKSKVLDYNAAAESIFGYSKEEVLGKDFLEYITPDVAKSAQPLIEVILSKMTSHHFISPTFSRSGEKLMLNWFVTPVKDPLNDTVYVLSLAENITNKMQVEEELREKEQRWMLVLNGNNDGIYDWNIKTGEIFFSDRYKEILGFEPHEPPNSIKEAGEMIHPDDLEKVSKLAFDYLAKKIPEYRSEHRERCKDGSYKWVNNRGLAIWDAEGNPVRMVGSRTDITERRNTENHLRMIESVVLSVNDGVVITVGEYDENRMPEIIYVNKSFTKITGYGMEEAVGRTSDLVSGPKTDPAVLERLSSFFRQKKESYKDEVVIYRKDGSSLWIEFSIDPILDEFGKINYWVWVLRDITKRKEAEEELKKINFELDSFVYRASHDLRAPLTSIIGLVNIGNNEQDLTTIRNYFEMISESAKKLDRYIINLLSLSRNSRLEVSDELINFEEIITDTFDELKYMKHAERLKLTYTIDQEHHFHSDGLRLKVIFKNLLSNAIKYQNTTCECSFLDIKITIDKSSAVLVLTDNGIGISDSIIEKVFDMFFRGTEVSDGSGLGLYIVKNVLSKMNGNISINSNVMKGSSFLITIPNNNPVL